MGKIDDAWSDLYDLPVFDREPTDDRAKGTHNMLWEFTEKLQKEGRLREIDVTRLHVVIESSYRLGVIAGIEEERDR
jgi:hypothetical protein